MDGHTMRWFSGQTWIQAHNGIARWVFDADAEAGVSIAASGGANTWLGTSRVMALFDTSVIDPGKTILEVTLKVYGSTKNDGLNIQPALVVVGSNPASNTLLVLADHTHYFIVPFAPPILYGNFHVSNFL